MSANVRSVKCVLLACLVLVCAARPAKATLIAYEPFNGTTNGSELVGQDTGGTGFSGAWAGVTGVDKYEADVLMPYTDSMGKHLVQSGHGVKVAKTQQANAAAQYRTLSDPVAETGTYYVSGMFYAYRGANVPYYGLGLRNDGGIVLGQYNNAWSVYDFNGSGPGPTVAIPSSQQAFLVAKLVKNNPTGEVTATLWVNPQLMDESGSGAGVSGVIPGPGTNGTWSAISTPVWTTGSLATPSGYMADIRIGTTFNDVTPYVGAPEPSTIILLFTGLWGLLAYTWRKRR